MLAWLSAPLLVLLMALPLAATAQDFITTKGRLSDEDFYRIVACTAPPGEPCREELVRWAPEDAANLSVAIVDIKPGFPEEKVAEVQTALDAAIAQINGAGAALKMTRVAPEDDPHITVHLWDQDEGDAIDGLGFSSVDGNTLGSGYVYIWWDGNKDLTRAVILLARDIAYDEITSIMLEELTQATGLTTDIDNSWYHTRSIFVEETNWITALQPQDKMALRRHYPKQ